VEKPNGPGDAGFTLVEVLTSLAVIGVVLTAVTTFFVRSMATVDAQGARQAAIQLAADGMERLREVPGPLAYDWLVSHGTEDVRANTVKYIRTWDAPTVASLMQATVRVRWTDRTCPGNTCSYSATTLISTADYEPLFEPAAA
jgi:prepilin-type N-terminal cleavage/methylation domain-containing protein